MNSNTYIQYLTRSGLVKTVEVERVEEAQFVKFTVSGIQEEFFLLNLFDNNKKIDGLTFDNVQNLQMLSFLNSDFQTVEVIPDNFYMNAFDVVVISLDRSALPAVSNSVVVENFPYPQQCFVENFPNFPDVQHVFIENHKEVQKVQPFPFYDPYRHPIRLDLQNKEIEGVNIQFTDLGNPFTAQFIDTLQNFRSYQSFQIDYLTPNNGEFNFYGFTIYVSGGWDVSFDFLVDTQFNIFDVVKTFNPYYPYNCYYLGVQKGLHKWVLTDGQYIDGVVVDETTGFYVYVGYKVPVGYAFVAW